MSNTSKASECHLQKNSPILMFLYVFSTFIFIKSNSLIRVVFHSDKQNSTEPNSQMIQSHPALLKINVSCIYTLDLEIHVHHFKAADFFGTVCWRLWGQSHFARQIHLFWNSIKVNFVEVNLVNTHTILSFSSTKTRITLGHCSTTE